MASEVPPDITAKLAALGTGDADALNGLIPIVYQELRRLARKQLANQPPGHTLESAALVNEVYLKLVRTDGIRCDGRLQFLALCAQIIRRILVDHARSRHYAKRGGHAVRLPLDEGLLAASVRGIDTLALDEALEVLSKTDARKGRVVELRYFGGLSFDETADVLGISRETAKRDWRMARAWLIGELGLR